MLPSGTSTHSHRFTTAPPRHPMTSPPDVPDPAPGSPLRPTWRAEALVLLALAIVSTLLFHFTNWDMTAARWFYVPGPALGKACWPHLRDPLWFFFYHSAPWITGVLAFGAIGTLLAGSLKPRFRRYRIHAVFILLTVALGPGVLVNSVFKDHWGRPRPCQVEEFGGHYQYHSVLEKGTAGRGKSFPCGHSSVGFAYCVFYFLWRRKRPAWAWTALGLSVFLGMLMGFGRMAAGAHFLSDVLWSGYIPFGTALALYYFVLRIPQKEAVHAGAVEIQPPGPWRRAAVIGGYSAVGVATAFVLLLASPVYEDIDWVTPPHMTAPILEIQAPKANVRVLFPDSTKGLALIRVTGTVRGFGLPGHKIRARLDQSALPERVRFRVTQDGTFTELECDLTVTVHPDYVPDIRVAVEHGDIEFVASETPPGTKTIRVATAEGTVNWPESGALDAARQAGAGQPAGDG